LKQNKKESVAILSAHNSSASPKKTYHQDYDGKSRRTMVFNSDEQEPMKTNILKAFQRGTMYHCTQRKNLLNILKNGLIPKKPQGIDESIAIKGVYLSAVPFDWMHYTTKESQEPGCHIEVNITGLELIYDNGVLELEDYEYHPAFIYTSVIPPERFINISVSTKKNPCKFRSIKIPK